MYDKQETKFDALVVGGKVETENLMAASDIKKGDVVASYGVCTSATKAKLAVVFTGTPVASEACKIVINGYEVDYTTGSTTLATEVAGIKAAINLKAGLKDIVAADNSSGTLTLEWKTAGRDGNGKVEVGEFTAGDSGLTMGEPSVDTYGEDVGDERVAIVDSDSGTSALQEPVGVALEDIEAGKFGTIAFCGEFDQAALNFSSGDTLNTFKVKLRKIGIFAKACV